MISIKAEFWVVSENEFPDGLICIRCKRPIGPGQPYSNVFTGMCYWEGLEIPEEEIICVYC